MSNDVIISAARDKTVRSWTRTSANTFSPDKVYLGHGHFVNALTTIKPNETYPNGMSIFRNIFTTLLNSYCRSYYLWWF